MRDLYSRFYCTYICLSSPLLLALRPYWLALRPLQLALGPLGWMENGQTDGWTDGWMDGWSFSSVYWTLSHIGAAALLPSETSKHQRSRAMETLTS